MNFDKGSKFDFFGSGGVGGEGVCGGTATKTMSDCQKR